jgi:hypothetical protein
MLIFSETMPTIVHENNFMTCRGSSVLTLRSDFSRAALSNTSLRAVIVKSTASSRMVQLFTQQEPMIFWMICHSAGAGISSGVVANLVN